MAVILVVVLLVLHLVVAILLLLLLHRLLHFNPTSNGGYCHTHLVKLNHIFTLTFIDIVADSALILVFVLDMISFTLD